MSPAPFKTPKAITIRPSEHSLSVYMLLVLRLTALNTLCNYDSKIRSVKERERERAQPLSFAFPLSPSLAVSHFVGGCECSSLLISPLILLMSNSSL